MAANPDTIFETIEFTLNGQPVEALQGETILQAAERTGTEIPHLCYTEGLRADGNCRACVVEIDGEPNRQACQERVREGMRVRRQRGPRKLEVEDES